MQDLHARCCRLQLSGWHDARWREKVNNPHIYVYFFTPKYDYNKPFLVAKQCAKTFSVDFIL
jgi:hypothetical protein